MLDAAGYQYCTQDADWCQGIAQDAWDATGHQPRTQDAAGHQKCAPDALDAGDVKTMSLMSRGNACASDAVFIFADVLRVSSIDFSSQKLTILLPYELC